MAVLSSQKTRQALLKKGFVQHDGDHHWFLYYYKGKVVARTKISHNDQEIGSSLISKMHKQCQVAKKDFMDLINCPLDEKGYQQILDERGLLK